MGLQVGRYGPLTGGSLTCRIRGVGASRDIRPLPAAESTEGKSSCGLSGLSVMGAGVWGQ